LTRKQPTGQRRARLFVRPACVRVAQKRGLGAGGSEHAIDAGDANSEFISDRFARQAVASKAHDGILSDGDRSNGNQGQHGTEWSSTSRTQSQWIVPGPPGLVGGGAGFIGPPGLMQSRSLESRGSSHPTPAEDALAVGTGSARAAQTASVAAKKVIFFIASLLKVGSRQKTDHSFALGHREHCGGALTDRRFFAGLQSAAPAHLSPPA
jgi:hypothetical protein